MEFKEGKIKAESTRAHLRQQVEEQSELCDFTLKMGYWTRRYHRCVLSGSPFFQCILDGDFREKSQGCVEFAFGTPASLDAAVLFLYGKCPKIDMANISDLLNFAEYFLLSNLKSLCVRWVKSANVTKENFFNLLQMSSLYDFELASCYDYIKEHINECFENQEFPSVTKETIEILFADEKLAYVTADAKFTFLLKWAKQRGTQGIQDMLEVLSLVDLNEVSPALVQEANDDTFFKDSKMVFNEPTQQNDGSKCAVLMKKAPRGSADFWVLDFSGQKWYRLDVQSSPNTYTEKYFSKSAADSVLYSITSTYNSTSVIQQDLEQNTVTKTDLVVKTDLSDFSLPVKHISCSAFVRETVFTALTESVKGKRRSNEESLSRYDLETRIALMSQLGASVSEILALSALNRHFYTSSRTVTVLYKGILNSSGEETELKPLVSFSWKVRESSLCANSVKTVAMFDQAYNLHLYDAVDLKEDIISHGFKYEDKVYPADMGFVVYNRNRIICITRKYGPCLTERYQTSQIDLKRNESSNFSYYFVGNMWIRYKFSYYDNDEKNVCEYALHEDLLACKSVDTTKWITLPSTSSRDYLSNIENAAMISLPRSLLKCHIDCPHCNRIRREKQDESRRHFRNHSNFDLYDTDDDDSDDNYYGVYDYGYDDYYYYSSD